MTSNRLRLASLFVLILSATQNGESRGTVSAFSSPGGAVRQRPRTGACEALHVSTSPISSYSAFASLQDPVCERLLDDRIMVTAKKSTGKATEKRRTRKPRMLRPKSLNSSSAKLATPTIASKKKKYPDLLTREEECFLTNNLRTLRTVVRIRDELAADMSKEAGVLDGNILVNPSETQWATACGLSVMQLRRIMFDGQEARSKLVAANGGLVTSIAKKHYFSLKQATEAGGGVGTILTMQDMIQEGNMGLMEAAERFEPERGFRFSTYATWWVRQRILRSISDYSRVIRLPAHGELE